MNKRAVKSDIDKTAAAEFANPIEQLRQAKPDAAQRIGEEMLGDVETVVYRINHVDLLGIKGKAEMKVWVAPKTKLPVRIEIRDTQRAVSLSFDRFEWNKPLDAKLFDIDAPDGFTIDNTLGSPPPMK